MKERQKVKLVFVTKLTWQQQHKMTDELFFIFTLLAFHSLSADENVVKLLHVLCAKEEQ
jgi:hypothetical protein